MSSREMLPFNAAAAVPDVASVLTGLSALAQCQSAAELQQKLVGWLAELGNCALVQLYLLDASHSRLPLCCQWLDGQLGERGLSA